MPTVYQITRCLALESEATKEESTFDRQKRQLKQLRIMLCPPDSLYGSWLRRREVNRFLTKLPYSAVAQMYNVMILASQGHDVHSIEDLAKVLSEKKKTQV